MMTRSEKVAYVQKQLIAGLASYYGISSERISQLDDARLEVEFDCAKNWAGEE
jgi:hypothetical protein